MVMRCGCGPRQVWGGDTSTAYSVNDMLVRTMCPADVLAVVARMVEDLILAFADGGDDGEGGNTNVFPEQ